MKIKTLRKSRKDPVEGDVFTYTFDRKRYYWGRVVRTGARVGPFPNCLLLYFFAAPSGSPDEVPQLRKEDLAVPPLLTNKRPWTMGYFVTAAHFDITEADRFSRHCFKHPVSGKVYDEDGIEVADGCKPLGSYLLHSYQTIADELARALKVRT